MFVFSVTPVQKGVSLHSSLQIKICKTHDNFSMCFNLPTFCLAFVTSSWLPQPEDAFSMTEIVKYCSQNASSLNHGIFNIFSYYLN